ARGRPAADEDHKSKACDRHVIPPRAWPPVLKPHPFNGIIDGNLRPSVNIMGRAAATTGSTAINDPEHKPSSGNFAKKPTNLGTIQTGSRTVFINRKPAARNGDTALTCNDPKDLPEGTVVATGTVMIG